MDANELCASVNNLHDLEQVLQKKDKVIAMVYASWCPFCRKVLPVFEQQAREQQGRLLLVADDEEHVAELYDIEIFPTLLLFEKGRMSKRLDGRPGIGLHDQQIVDFIQSCPLP